MASLFSSTEPKSKTKLQHSSTKPGSTDTQDLEKLETTVNRVAIADLKHLTKNARYMTGDQLRRLVENLRRDGELTSYPLVYRPDPNLNPDFYEQSKGELIILSGNHRVEAAREAGITHTNAIEIRSKVSDERLRAIQLSHNSINGQDDPSILLQLYESLSLDEKLYSGLTDDDFDVEPIDVSGLGIGTVKYAEVTLSFIPSEIEEVNRWMEDIEKAGRRNATLVSRYEDFDLFFETVVRVKQEQKVYNSAIAFATLVQLATERLDQLRAESEQDDTLLKVLTEELT
jgi:hypothetical protein